MKREFYLRCDHCGRFVNTQQSSLFTLELTVVGSHGADVAICEPCWSEYTNDSEYWQKWVDSRYPQEAHDGA